jgi:hypothetical protein
MGLLGRLGRALLDKYLFLRMTHIKTAIEPPLRKSFIGAARVIVFLEYAGISPL